MTTTTTTHVQEAAAITLQAASRRWLAQGASRSKQRPPGGLLGFMFHIAGLVGDNHSDEITNCATPRTTPQRPTRVQTAAATTIQTWTLKTVLPSEPRTTNTHHEENNSAFDSLQLQSLSKKQVVVDILALFWVVICIVLVWKRLFVDPQQQSSTNGMLLHYESPLSNASQVGAWWRVAYSNS